MTTQAFIACIIFVVSLIFIIWQPIHPVLIGALIPAALATFGIIEAKSAYQEFANTTVVFFVALVVIGKAFFVTGLADFLGEKIIGLIGATEHGLIFGTGIVAGGMSAFLNDTGTTGCLIPIISSMAEKAKVSKSKLLMALAYFSSLGGTITLIGTTPHIVANGFLVEWGYRELGFFEYTKIGIPLLVIGMLYMYFIGIKLLPDKEIILEKSNTKQNRDKKKMIIVSFIFICVVLSMAVKVIPMHIAAVIGACLVVLTKCITIDQALSAISPTSVFLVGGVFPLSTALTKSGAAEFFINQLTPYLSGLSPVVLLAGIILIMLISTQFLMNSSATVLVLPMAIMVAKAGGIDPLAAAMGVSVAASGAFITPFGTGPNLLVWEAGGYQVKDYIKCGLPLLFLFWIVSTIMCYIIYL